MFNEEELEQAIAGIDALLPDELLTEAAVAAKKIRKRGFWPSLTRVRVELTLTDVEKLVLHAPSLPRSKKSWNTSQPNLMF